MKDTNATDYFSTHPRVHIIRSQILYFLPARDFFIIILIILEKLIIKIQTEPNEKFT